MSGCEASVSIECDSCGGIDVGAVYETIIDGRLHWVLTQKCGDSSVEEFGWDATPGYLRQAILDQCGAHLLRIDGGLGNFKPAVMKVIRRRGTALNDVLAILGNLQGRGLQGTEVELRILANALKDAGASVSIEPA